MRPLVTEIALAASKYRSAVIIETASGMLDAKSVMGVFTSFVDTKPTAIYIQGDDANEARADIERVLKQFNLEIEIK